MNAPAALPVIDMHVHVGLVGDELGHWGHMLPAYRRKPVFRVFLFFAGLAARDVNDRTLRESTLAVIGESSLDGVVCLALDPVFDLNGVRRPERSTVWVANDYVLELRRELPGKIHLGASVHPFDPEFESRVKALVDEGAVLLKWLPSAQHIDLADPRVGERLAFLATVGPGGRPLPLLLHVGPEYAIPSTNRRTTSWDFLSWTRWDRFWNRARFFDRWHVPRVEAAHRNLERGLVAGATIIFAHCGLPYFAAGGIRGALEHSDYHVVRRYLEGNATRERGRCYADVSACCTLARKSFFPAIRELPADSLLFGSDFPAPIFELYGGLPEAAADVRAALKGDLKRLVVPQDNLLDVNLRELRHAFPDHPLFTNFARLTGLG